VTTRYKLTTGYPNAYGTGKTHVLSRESQYTYTWCGRTIYGTDRWGKLSEVDCKQCHVYEPSGYNPTERA
jgi:hypothetical protein